MKHEGDFEVRAMFSDSCSDMTASVDFDDVGLLYEAIEMVEIGTCEADVIAVEEGHFWHQSGVWHGQGVVVETASKDMDFAGVATSGGHISADFSDGTAILFGVEFLIGQDRMDE